MELQKAKELVEKNKKERQERAWKKLNDFIIALEKEENVSIGIQPIQIQPQIIIVAK